MKAYKKWPIFVILHFLFLLSVYSHPPRVEARGLGLKTADRTISPYFFVNGGDPDADQLPLKETRAHVRILGVIADVAIEQTYRNEGKRTIEAIYMRLDVLEMCVGPDLRTVIHGLMCAKADFLFKRAQSLKNPRDPAILESRIAKDDRVVDVVLRDVPLRQRTMTHCLRMELQALVFPSSGPGGTTVVLRAVPVTR